MKLLTKKFNKVKVMLYWLTIIRSVYSLLNKTQPNELEKNVKIKYNELLNYATYLSLPSLNAGVSVTTDLM